MKLVFTFLLFILVQLQGAAQVVISPLGENPQLIKLYEKGVLATPSYEKSNITLHLPFIDDFSKNHLPGSEKVYWENNYVFINPSYPVAPPTIGVATFDGLDYNGYPYNFESPTAYGGADTLTSCAINLSEDEDGDPYFPSDSIYLSFYYQAQGLGDSPESQDSLILEFYDAESDSWTSQWSSEGHDLSSFAIVYIPIIDDLYFSPDFRFRFRNFATLSGNLDHWHLDVVWIDKNRSMNELGFSDVGFQYPVNRLLSNYTAMPYTHYQLVSSAFMIDEATAQLRNNNNVAINLSGVKMLNYSEGSLVNETPFPGTIDNFPAQSSASFDIPVYDGSSGYIFDPNLDGDFVSFRNEFVMSSGTFDLIEDNDTIIFNQRLENYYSYDDHSAEAGIGLNVNGGRLVNKFESVTGDYLIGYKIYFNPITNNPIYPFLMWVYDEANDGTGKPGDLIHVNTNFSQVTFGMQGQDYFKYYLLDSAVFVNGSFFVGISQTSSTSLNIGFDRNIDTHEEIYYNIGLEWVQLSESVNGSLMLRPVFTSDRDDIIMGIQKMNLSFTTLVYPNPANESITIKSEVPQNIFFEISGMDGRIITQDQFYHQIELNTSDFAEGIYIIRLHSENGTVNTEKLILRH
jgi:hypothetical protein